MSNFPSLFGKIHLHYYVDGKYVDHGRFIHHDLDVGRIIPVSYLSTDKNAKWLVEKIEKDEYVWRLYLTKFTAGPC